MSGNNHTDENKVFTITSNDETVPKDITAISFGPTVTVIENSWSLSGCSLLTLVFIPESVARIGTMAFSYCHSLESVFVPYNSVTVSIGCMAFSHCSRLTSINIPSSVVDVGNFAFTDCSSLVKITLPQSIRTIGEGAFMHCSSLITINIPSSVVRIGNWAFRNCPRLHQIAILSRCIGPDIDIFEKCHALEQRKAHGINYHTNTNVWVQQRFFNLPIHQQCYTNADSMTIQLVSHLTNVYNSTLTLTDAMGMTCLHILCSNPDANKDSIKALKAAYPDAATVRSAIGMTPLECYLMSRSLPYDNLYCQDGGNVSILMLLKYGFECDILEALLDIFVDKRDIGMEGEEGNEGCFEMMLPFMAAASLPNCGLDVVYMLAMKCPDLLGN